MKIDQQDWWPLVAESPKPTNYRVIGTWHEGSVTEELVQDETGRLWRRRSWHEGPRHATAERWFLFEPQGTGTKLRFNFTFLDVDEEQASRLGGMADMLKITTVSELAGSGSVGDVVRKNRDLLASLREEADNSKLDAIADVIETILAKVR